MLFWDCWLESPGYWKSPLQQLFEPPIRSGEHSMQPCNQNPYGDCPICLRVAADLAPIVVRLLVVHEPYTTHSLKDSDSESRRIELTVNLFGTYLYSAGSMADKWHFRDMFPHWRVHWRSYRKNLVWVGTFAHSSVWPGLKLFISPGASGRQAVTVFNLLKAWIMCGISIVPFSISKFHEEQGTARCLQKENWLVKLCSMLLCFDYSLQQRLTLSMRPVGASAGAGLVII